MTLYDYIASLTVDSQPLVWNFKPLTSAQIAASAGRPYVRVAPLPATVWKPLYENADIMSQLVDIQIFQEADSNGNMPNRNDAVGLFYDLDQIPAYVDQHIYGQPLIKASREVDLMPDYDEDTGGLFGMLRFRLLYAREARVSV